jgi:hypothetical protein
METKRKTRRGRVRMSQERELEKFNITASLVYCPKDKKIVESTLACPSCPHYKGQDWQYVKCSYQPKEEEESKQMSVKKAEKEYRCLLCLLTELLQEIREMNQKLGEPSQ